MDVMKKLYLLVLLFLNATTCTHAQVTINSQPSGAKVYQEGNYIGTTPCRATIHKKAKELVYDIDANRVSEPSQPPYSIEFTLTMDGYETATVYFEGKYEYHKSGVQKYHIVKPKSYSLFAVLKKSYQEQPTYSNNVQQNQIETKQTVITETIPDIRWHFDSDPEDAKIFWRVKSSVPNNVKNTELLYLGKTPFNETKPLNIKGLNKDNSDKVEIEIVIEKKGYIKQNKLFSGNPLIDQQEISWFFELIKEPVPEENTNTEIEIESVNETTNQLKEGRGNM